VVDPELSIGLVRVLAVSVGFGVFFLKSQLIALFYALKKER